MMKHLRLRLVMLAIGLTSLLVAMSLVGLGVVAANPAAPLGTTVGGTVTLPGGGCPCPMAPLCGCSRPTPTQQPVSMA